MWSAHIYRIWDHGNEPLGKLHLFSLCKYIFSFISFFKCQLRSSILWANTAWARVWASTTSSCGLRSVNWSQQESKSSIHLWCFKNSDWWEFDLLRFAPLTPGSCLAIVIGQWPGWFVVTGCEFSWHLLPPLERTEEVEWSFMILPLWKAPCTPAEQVRGKLTLLRPWVQILWVTRNFMLQALFYVHLCHREGFSLIGP